MKKILLTLMLCVSVACGWAQATFDIMKSQDTQRILKPYNICQFSKDESTGFYVLKDVSKTILSSYNNIGDYHFFTYNKDDDKYYYFTENSIGYVMPRNNDGRFVAIFIHLDIYIRNIKTKTPSEEGV